MIAPRRWTRRFFESNKQLRSIINFNLPSNKFCIQVAKVMKKASVVADCWGEFREPLCFSIVKYTPSGCVKYTPPSCAFLLTSRQHDDVIQFLLNKCGGDCRCQFLVIVIYNDDLAGFIFLLWKLLVKEKQNTNSNDVAKDVGICLISKRLSNGRTFISLSATKIWAVIRETKRLSETTVIKTVAAAMNFSNEKKRWVYFRISLKQQAIKKRKAKSKRSEFQTRIRN